MIYTARDPTLKVYLAQAGLKTLGHDPGSLDNWWGPRSEAAYQGFLSDQAAINTGIASVFADPKDLAVFAKCKARGNTDLFCFRTGDNGIGASGRITAQMLDPMVALHPLDIRAKWGEMSKAWGKKIVIEYEGKTCIATLEDYMSSVHAEIDLNPAAVAELGIPPGGMVPVTWRWQT
ncbi:MAG: hypothetical protein H0U23_17895 [Blastocatellia bacterium]|jgi:expansin (peptidoglycan-binding protein)|nr:hypothetical protein [Blastocatellia bacterium]